MSLGNLIGQMLEQGLSGQTQTRERVGSTARNLGQEGQGIEQILGSLQQMLGAARVLQLREAPRTARSPVSPRRPSGS
jgi:hypothetical protein